MKNRFVKYAALALSTLLLTGSLLACAKSDPKKITVAASSTPHAEILEQCKEPLKEKGYTLEIKVMGDYVTPNTATEDGEVDANYFQHQPYLDNFNEEKGTHLVTVAGIHVEPMGIYGGKQSDLTPVQG